MNTRFFRIALFTIIMGSAFLFVSFVWGETQDVVITEICPAGCASEPAKQWLEIYNKGDEPVDLLNWIFWENSTNHGLKLVQGASSFIEPGDYALIVEEAEVFLTTYAIESDKLVFDSSWGALNKSGEEIGLKVDKTSEAFIEKFTYPALSTNTSLERLSTETADYSSNNWQAHPDSNSLGVENYWTIGNSITNITNDNANEITEDTETEIEEEPIEILKHSETCEEKSQTEIENEIVTKTDTETESFLETEAQTIAKVNELTSDIDEAAESQSNDSDYEVKIIINEFVSDPVAGEKEWIELYNITSTTIVLDGWVLKDNIGTIVTLASSLAAHEFLVIEISQSKLNNSGDVITLVAPDSTVIDEVYYGDYTDEQVTSTIENAPAASDPQSVARIHDGVDSDNDQVDFAITTIITKGAANIINSPAVLMLIPLPATAVSPSVTSSGGPSANQTSVKIFAPSALVINELVSDPTDGSEEFIELYNNLAESVDLSGWWVQEGSNTKTELAGLIPAFGFVIIEKPKGNLNNNGDIVLLFDSSGKEIDRLTYGEWNDGFSADNAKAAADPFSLSRKKDGYDTNLDANDFTLTTIITKGGANVIVYPAETLPGPVSQVITPTTKPVEQVLGAKLEIKPKKETEAAPTNSRLKNGEVVISEIFPNPANSQLFEFIELQNTTNEEISLAGFFLDDGENGSKPYLFPKGTVIGPLDYVAYFHSDTNIILNNSDDAVRLFSPSKAVIDEVSYIDTIKGSAYALTKEGKWEWTEQATPGKENRIDVSTDEQKINVQNTKVLTKTKNAKLASKSEKKEVINMLSIEQLKTFPLGTKVLVRGVVSVLPGDLSDRFFYISSPSSTLNSLQVYMHNGKFPTLNIGDVVEITGEISQAARETRIKISSSESIVLSGLKHEIIPTSLEIGQIDESLLGALVALSGEITELQSTLLYIDDSTAEIEVSLKALSGASDGLMIGNTISVIGIIQKTKKGVRITPQNSENIILVESNMALSSLPVKKNNKEKGKAVYLAAGAGSILSVVGSLVVLANKETISASLRHVPAVVMNILRKQ